jgi:hypothetical protein
VDVVTGEAIYSAYCHVMAQLPWSVTKGEALPAWDFIDGDLALAWTALGAQVQRAPRDVPKKTVKTQRPKRSL